MENKTCVECCGFSESENRCLLLGGRGKTYADNEACRRFSEKKPIPPLTNGDKIRQGGDYALAHFKSEHRCDVCAYAAPLDEAPACRRPKGKVCFDGMLAWLNAPADVCVAENGKSAKQAYLSCKSEKESEGKDE